jgi:hypothetical protein
LVRNNLTIKVAVIDINKFKQVIIVKLKRQCIIEQS